MIDKSITDKFSSDLHDALDIQLIQELDVLDKIGFDTLGCAVNDIISECRASVLNELGCRYYELIKKQFKLANKQ